ncbi:MAG: GAF domain-containing protein, partial [Anaerolineae bacterium]|nr:GAF domain-containing protein [Anaerolineae bacterium]
MTEKSRPTALQTLLDQIVQSLNHQGWDIVILMLHDEAQTPTIAAVATTDPDSSSTLRTNPPLAIQPATWRQAKFRISASYWLPPAAHTRDEYVVILPLQADQQEIGWLYLSAPQTQQATIEQQIGLLETIAHQTARAITQDHTQVQQQKRMAQQTVLSDLARTIGHHLEMDDLFAAVTAQLEHVFSFERASIVLRQDSRARARTLVKDEQSVHSATDQTASALEDIAVAQIIQGDHLYAVAVALTQEPQSETEQALAAQGIQSYCCLALQMWGHTFGALNLASTTQGTFHQDEAEFLVEIAEHVAVAVWNALLHEVEQHRRQAADALVRLSKAVNSTLNLERVLALALEELEYAVAYDTASILLTEDDYLRITACRGFDDPQSVVGLTFRPEEGNISHTVVSSQQIRVVDDVQALAEWGHNREDAEGYDSIRAWIGAPLIVRERGIGLLVLDKYEPSFYTEEDGEIVMAFATQIALAIANARLYQAADEQRTRLAAILTDTSDAVIVLDTIQRIWLINPAAERMLRVQHTRVVGQRINALNVPELERVFRDLPDDAAPVTHEIKRENETFNANIAPVRDVGWVIAMQDITALKELDRLRTEWVAAVSHDLK